MWNNVNKPTGPTYTNVNTPGKEQYDQSNILYDDSNVFYDGINPNQWSDVSKPQLGQPTWNDLQMQWQQNQNTWNGNGSAWNKVSKPI